MSRETKYLAIILKKQPYLEGDEIITFFTKQQGKVRALAKSVKSPKSKLQQRLQALFVVELTLSHGKMPKIISVEPVEVFAGLRQNLAAVKMAFYGIELVLKFTPDEHKNKQLFLSLMDFLHFLDAAPANGLLDLALAKFKLNSLSALGLEITFPSAAPQELLFSPSLGGFTGQKTADGINVKKPVRDLFLSLKTAPWEKIPALEPSPATEELQSLLSSFVEYQLERQMKSEKYLRSA